MHYLLETWEGHGHSDNSSLTLPIILISPFLIWICCCHHMSWDFPEMVSLWPFMSHLGNPAPALAAAKRSHKAPQWLDFLHLLSALLPCWFTKELSAMWVPTNCTVLKKSASCLLESEAAFQTSNLRRAGKNSLCHSYAFKIAINVVSVLFLDSFYHDHIPVEVLLTSGLYRRIC